MIKNVYLVFDYENLKLTAFKNPRNAYCNFKVKHVFSL